MTSRESTLIDGYIDESLSPEEFAELQSVLRESAEAREQVRLRIEVDEQLKELARHEESGDEEKVVSFPFWKTAFPWAVAALLAFALVFDRIEWPGNRDPEFSALLVSHAGAVFDDRFSPDEVRFRKGEYRLKEGAAHLRFSNGTDLVMKAPVEFQIEDSFHMDLKSGAVRAIVPPSGQGFTIATPGIDYEDLGTEFGVSVDEDSGASKIHVFDGQVDARLDEAPEQILSSVFRGESREFSSGELVPTKAPDADEFLSPEAISFLRWKNWSQKIQEDESLIGYFPFERSGDRHVLKSGASLADGGISGARRVTGRWPGKGALLFDRTSDYVELEIPGAVDEMTISVWLNVLGLDQEITAILDSNGWDPGDVHWQINRHGFPWIGINGNVARKEFVGSPIIPGQWSHVVMVLSKERASAEVYVNGKLAEKSALNPGANVTPGTCRLGNWLRDPEWEHEPVRAFRGRIDELAIWNRSLSSGEIQEVFESGRPSLLWNYEANRLTASGH